jgi:hypothetical protein
MIRAWAGAVKGDVNLAHHSEYRLQGFAVNNLPVYCINLLLKGDFNILD